MPSGLVTGLILPSASPPGADSPETELASLILLVDEAGAAEAGAALALSALAVGVVADSFADGFATLPSAQWTWLPWAAIRPAP